MEYSDGGWTFSDDDRIPYHEVYKPVDRETLTESKVAQWLKDNTRDGQPQLADLIVVLPEEAPKEHAAVGMVASDD